MNGAVTIIPFEPSLAPHFSRLNKAWIQKYFVLEPQDEPVLADPQINIIDKGGLVLFAQYDNAIAGTVALQYLDDTTFELSKMAVDEAYQGLKIGQMLLQAAITQAKGLGAQKLVLYSNTALLPAIHLYRKKGFVEVPMEHSEYKRSDIKMEKSLL